MNKLFAAIIATFAVTSAFANEQAPAETAAAEAPAAGEVAAAETPAEPAHN